MSILLRRFDDIVAKWGSHTAIVQGEKRITYSELNARAAIFDSQLTHAGVSAGSTVALKYTRSIDLFIAMLGILKHGSVYLPLDEASPLARLSQCLDIAKVSIICCDTELPAILSDGVKVMRAGSVAEDEVVSVPSSSNFSDETPAYIMFTSGSTGLPKGVEVPHRAIARLVIDTNFIDISPDDVVLQLSPVSFDASTLEIWGALLNGASLVLYSGAVLDPQTLKNDIATHNVTIAWLTAALFHLIGSRFIEALRPLRVLLAGGDVLHASVIRNVLTQLPGLVIVNGYGPTENTTFTCCHRMTSQNMPSDSVPIGVPISGTQIHILDDQRRPVSDGEVGELYASGLGVALGYLNNSDTEAFFFDSSIAEGLIYRTGDLVRRSAQGPIEFRGRQDNQVKLRGFRVSLEDISNSLLALDSIDDAIVFVDKRKSSDQLLIAYVRSVSEENTDAAKIRKQMGSIVPGYMIPDKVILNDELPVTANGKLDRKAILAIYNES